MKKVLNLTLALAVMAILCPACSSNGGSSPRNLADKAMKCLINNDSEGFANTFNLTEETKADFADVYNKVISSEVTSNGGIESYKIVDSSIGEGGDTAKVNIHIKYKNGTESDEPMYLVKVNGEWLQDPNYVLSK